jgi:Tfp pilus assembly protein PilP
MKPTRAAAYVLGGMLLAAWLAAAAGVRAPSIPALPDRSPEAVQLDDLASGVQAQALRLRQRLSSAPAPRATIRNPFEFVVLQPPAAASDRKPIAAPPLAVEGPPEPNLVLIGLAEDGATRTAMIESGDELVMATEGQTIVGRYRVVKVSVDGIELTDLVSGTTRRLFLRSPASLL